MPMVNGKKYPYTKKGKEAAKKAIDFLESSTNLPVTDVVRYGPEKLGLAIKQIN